MAEAPHESLRARLRRRRRERRQAGKAGVMRAAAQALRNYIVTGLLVWIPLIITIWVTWWVVNTLGASVNNGIAWAVGYIQGLGRSVPVLSFLAQFEYKPWVGFSFAFALFLFTGILARWIVAQRVIAAAEHLLARIPFVSSVYTSAQQIRDVFTAQGGIVQEVVLIQFPQPGHWVIGLAMSREQGPVQRAVGRNMLAIFLPTTPNPTSGYLLYVPVEEVLRVDLSVEDAMKIVVSGGAYNPPRAAAPARLDAHGGACQVRAGSPRSTA